MQTNNKLGCDRRDLNKLDYRGNGWPGYAIAEDRNGKKRQMDYDSSWGKILGRDVHPACRFCMVGTGESADISCGDAWYLKADGTPDFSENEGRNFVFCRTKKGMEIYRQAVQHGFICSYDTDTKDLYRIQKYQFERKATMRARILAMKLMNRVVPPYSYMYLNNCSSYVGIRKEARVFAGTVKRILKGKIQ